LYWLHQNRDLVEQDRINTWSCDSREQKKIENWVKNACAAYS